VYTVLTDTINNEEFKLIKHFLDWNGTKFKVEMNAKKLTNNTAKLHLYKARPMLMEYDMISAFGFHGIVDFLN